MKWIFAALLAIWCTVASAQQAVTGVNPYGASGQGSVAYTLATPITATSANVANASAVATLAAASTTVTYITGFQCTAAGSTSGLAVTVTVAGVVTATMNYTFTAPAGVLVPAPPLVVKFDPPVPASAANTTIVVTMPALGAGNTNATCVAQGFRL